ncbi:MAG TPA: hypothetical protein VFG68_05775 [Fimbriiglobus sp.]|nr:hypothetical protein [Fimbriiglobus sp.]
MSSTARPWDFAGWATVAVAFAVGFALFPLRVVGPGLDCLPGDLIDSRLNNYVLEHGYRWLAGREPSFWDAPMFYPARRITAYSDAHIGMLPLYAALRAGGLSPESAYQGWFLAPFVLNFASCVWAVRRLGWGPAAAAAGAYLFAFGLPLATAVTQHAQLGPRFLVLPALVLAWEWAWSPTTRRLGWLAACVVGQAYLTLYVGYFLGLVLLIQWVTVAVLYPRSLPWSELLRPGRRRWAARLIVIAAAVVALLPLVVPHLQAGREHGHYPLETVRAFCPAVQSWLTPADLSWHGDWMGTLFPVPPDTEYTCEKQLFPGVVPVVALLAGLVLFRRQPVAGVSAVVVLLAVALTTRVGGYALYDPLLHLPGVPGMRVIGRVVLVLLFPLAVLVAAMAEELRRFGSVAALAVLGLLAADQLLVSRGENWASFRCPKAEAVARREQLAEVIRRHPDPRLVYVFPDPDGNTMASLIRQLDAMRAAQQLGLPTVNGWSGYWPPGWEMFADYGGLFRWLDEDRRTGLVVIGEPTGGDDPTFEARMRAMFPPLPFP